MKRNDYILVLILIVDVFGLFFITGGYSDCGLFNWCLFTAFIFSSKILSFKISINKTLELLYLILIFLSFVLGRVYDLYDKILWYDTLVHFISGILCFVFGLIILKKFHINNVYFTILFCVVITAFIGVLWEFVELGFDYVFHTNMMKVSETGVMDTMKDLSVAILSSAITGLLYIYNKESFE